MSETVVACEHMYAGYGRETVLRDVCLEIEEGAYLPVLGPNGAGKTTLLRCILGLMRPSRGRLVTRLDRHPPAYVPQNRSIDPLFPLTVEQIVVTGLYRELGRWRRPDEERMRRVEEVMERLRLTPFARKNYRELSGGTQQKVLVARALASEAKFLVLDEPTSELDADSEREIFEQLIDENRRRGKTVLFACHGLSAARLEAQKVCVVEHGRVAVEAAAKEEN